DRSPSCQRPFLSLTWRGSARAPDAIVDVAVSTTSSPSRRASTNDDRHPEALGRVVAARMRVARSGPAYALPPYIVHHDRIDFGDPIDRNPVALFESERMIRGLELDPRSLTIVAKMDTCLQIDCLRIRLEPCVQPTKERAHM